MVASMNEDYMKYVIWVGAAAIALGAVWILWLYNLQYGAYRRRT